MNRRVVSIASIALLLINCPCGAASRIEEIRTRGYLTCGVSFVVSGFARRTADGQVTGFEPDLCRAVAAAVLGLAGPVRFVAAASAETFLKTGEPDVVARRLTVTLRRDLAAGGAFSPVVFYDGVALMVRGSNDTGSPRTLTGRKICVGSHSETEPAAESYLHLNRITAEIVRKADLAAAANGFSLRECDALAGDLSELAALREDLADKGPVSILPTLLSKEPLALFIHGDDAQFAAVVRWTLYALIEAEELGVTRETITVARASEDAAVRMLVGQDPGNGAALGLDERWAEHALATVGNYGEIFERNLGSGSSLLLTRGMNALWRDGGLMYALPLR